MQCPVCTTEKLVMTERRGIEIDYCPKCRGVWLDRGELDKLIERSAEWDDDDAPPHDAARAAPRSGHVAPPPPPPPVGYGHPPPYDRRRDLDDSKYGYTYKKPKKWWHEIFD